MKNKFLYFTTFILGAAAGGYVAWMYAKKKFEAIADEEIASVKEAFAKKAEVADFITKGKPEVLNDMADIIEKKKVKPDLSSKNDYTDAVLNIDNSAEKIVSDKPYIIPPEEFGEFAGYESITLLYFSDEVLTDDDYELVDDVEATVGSESLTHFGEYEDDSVFVRNDRMKCDYEILLDYRKYSEVMAKNPIRFKEE